MSIANEASNTFVSLMDAALCLKHGTPSKSCSTTAAPASKVDLQAINILSGLLVVELPE
jgi:hypothetical protein